MYNKNHMKMSKFMFTFCKKSTPVSQYKNCNINHHLVQTKNILFNNKKNETVSITRKYLDNIKTCGCRVGMWAVNEKLIIQLEWP